MAENVIPFGEAELHTRESCCRCSPTVRWSADGDLILVHNSLRKIAPPGKKKDYKDRHFFIAIGMMIFSCAAMLFSVAWLLFDNVEWFGVGVAMTAAAFYLGAMFGVWLKKNEV